MQNVKKRRFSLIELLVTIAVIAILAGLLLPALNAAREKGRGIACMANLKQIGMFLLSYADDNDSWSPEDCDSAFQSGSGPITQSWQDRLMYYYMPNIPVSNLHHVETKDGKRKIRPIFACPGIGNAEFPESDQLSVYRHYGINQHMAKHDKINIPAYSGQRLAKLRSPSRRSWAADRGPNTVSGELEKLCVYVTGGAWKNTGYHIGYRHVDYANFVFADGHTGSRTFRNTPESYQDYFFSSDKGN